jgi:outer membrane biosynthesis protein TonB
MGRLSAFLLALILGGVSAVALVSCGGDSDAKLLPGTTASQIESNLDQVDQLVEAGDCLGAENAVAEVTAEVEELNDVAAKLKAALREGTAKLSEVVGRCEEETVEEETEPTLETEVEPEETEDEEKPEKEKPEKEPEESVEPAEEEPAVEEGPELPPQSNGKGEEKSSPAPVQPEAEVAPPSSSGGVSPSVGVGE